MKTGLWIVATICFVAGAFSVGAEPRKTQTATNLQVLKGKSDDEVFQTMQIWATQLGVQCSLCHVAGDNASDQKAPKATARKMYAIVETLNDQDFFKNGNRKADCYLCHKGSQRPARTPAPAGDQD